MKKARIVERIRQDGSRKYALQSRFLFWWMDIDEFDSLSNARSRLCFHDGTRIKERVVSDDASREPDPEVQAVVEKLHKMFKDRLSSGGIDDMGPYVSHEFEEDLPAVVNEAGGKVYIVRSPVHGRKVLVVDGDFAEKALALGSLP